MMLKSILNLVYKIPLFDFISEALHTERKIMWWYLTVKPLLYDLYNTRIFFFWNVTFKRYPWWKKLLIILYLSFQVALLYSLCYFFTAALSVVLFDPIIKNTAFKKYNPTWHKGAKKFSKTVLAKAWPTTLLQQSVVPRIFPMQVVEAPDSVFSVQSLDAFVARENFFGKKLRLVKYDTFGKKSTKLKRAFITFYKYKRDSNDIHLRFTEPQNYLHYSGGQQRLYRTLPYKKFWLAYYEAKYRLWINLTWQQMMRKTWFTRGRFSLDTGDAFLYAKNLDTERSLLWDKRLPTFKKYVLKSKAYAQLSDHGTLVRRKLSKNTAKRSRVPNDFFTIRVNQGRRRLIFNMHLIDRARGFQEGGLYRVTNPTFTSQHLKTARTKIILRKLLQQADYDILALYRRKKFVKRWYIKLQRWNVLQQTPGYFSAVAYHPIKERLHLRFKVLKKDVPVRPRLSHELPVKFNPVYWVYSFLDFMLRKNTKDALASRAKVAKRKKKYVYHFGYSYLLSYKHAENLINKRFIRNSFNIMSLPSMRHEHKVSKGSYVRSPYAKRAVPPYATSDVVPLHWTHLYNNSFIFVTQKDFQFKKYLFTLLANNHHMMSRAKISYVRRPVFSTLAIMRRKKKYHSIPRLAMHLSSTYYTPGVFYTSPRPKSALYSSKALYTQGLGPLRYLTKLNSHTLLSHTLWRRYSWNKFKINEESLHFLEHPSAVMAKGKRYRLLSNQSFAVRYAARGRQKFTVLNPNHPKNMKFGFKYLAYIGRSFFAWLGFFFRPVNPPLKLTIDTTPNTLKKFASLGEHPGFGDIYNTHMYNFYKKSYTLHPISVKYNIIKFYNYHQINKQTSEASELLDEKTQVPIISHYGNSTAEFSAEGSSWYLGHSNSALSTWWNKARRDRVQRGRRINKRISTLHEDRRYRRKINHKSSIKRSSVLLYPSYKSRASGSYSKWWNIAIQQGKVRQQDLLDSYGLRFRTYPSKMRALRYMLEDGRSRWRKFRYQTTYIMSALIRVPKWDRPSARYIKGGKYARSYRRVKWFNDYRHFWYRYNNLPYLYTAKRGLRKKRSWWKDSFYKWARWDQLFVSRVMVNTWMYNRAIFQVRDPLWGVGFRGYSVPLWEDESLYFPFSGGLYTKFEQPRVLRIFAVSAQRWKWMHKFINNKIHQSLADWWLGWRRDASFYAGFFYGVTFFCTVYLPIFFCVHYIITIGWKTLKNQLLYSKAKLSRPVSSSLYHMARSPIAEVENYGEAEEIEEGETIDNDKIIAARFTADTHYKFHYSVYEPYSLATQRASLDHSPEGSRIFRALLKVAQADKVILEQQAWLDELPVIMKPDIREELPDFQNSYYSYMQHLEQHDTTYNTQRLYPQTMYFTMFEWTYLRKMSFTRLQMFMYGWAQLLVEQLCRPQNIKMIKDDFGIELDINDIDTNFLGKWRIYRKVKAAQREFRGARHKRFEFTELMVPIMRLIEGPLFFMRAAYLYARCFQSWLAGCIETFSELIFINMCTVWMIIYNEEMLRYPTKTFGRSQEQEWDTWSGMTPEDWLYFHSLFIAVFFLLFIFGPPLISQDIAYRTYWTDAEFGYDEEDENMTEEEIKEAEEIEILEMGDYAERMYAFRDKGFLYVTSLSGEEEYEPLVDDDLISDYQDMPEDSPVVPDQWKMFLRTDRKVAGDIDFWGHLEFNPLFKHFISVYGLQYYILYADIMQGEHWWDHTGQRQQRLDILIGGNLNEFTRYRTEFEVRMAESWKSPENRTVFNTAEVSNPSRVLAERSGDNSYTYIQIEGPYQYDDKSVDFLPKAWVISNPLEFDISNIDASFDNIIRAKQVKHLYLLKQQYPGKTFKQLQLIVDKQLKSAIASHQPELFHTKDLASIEHYLYFSTYEDDYNEPYVSIYNFKQLHDFSVCGKFSELEDLLLLYLILEEYAAEEYYLQAKEVRGCSSEDLAALITSQQLQKEYQKYFK